MRRLLVSAALLALALDISARADVVVTATYDAPADAIWALVDFHAPSEAVMPPVASSERTGEGLGALKINRLKGGGEVLLQLVYYAPQDRAFNYVIRSGPLPVSQYVGAVRVADLGEGRSALTWQARYEPAGVSGAEADALLEGFLQSITARIGETYPAK
ncbi:MAG: SRPBCC family protein [Pikeienuella sp.]